MISLYKSICVITFLLVNFFLIKVKKNNNNNNNNNNNYYGSIFFNSIGSKEIK